MQINNLARKEAAQKSQSVRKKIVQLQNICKSYKSNTAKIIVNDVSLNIYEGELFALLGSSGCGKSTLLRMMAGFENPSSGNIIIDGQNMTNIPAYNRPLNMMFQSYALFPHMTVESNISFGLKQENLPKDEIKQRVAEAMAMVNISELAKRKPHQLSGGQQQRVALARSLIKRPKLLLLDEPLGALDRKNREHAQVEIIKIQEMLGITFIMVTHDQDEALAMANRIGIMQNGKIVQVDTPENIYEYPETPFVAEFIGSINIFHGRITKKSDQLFRLKINESEREVNIQSSRDFPLGSDVIIAIRPEEIYILQNDQAASNIINGNIIDIAFMGDKIIYHVAVSSDKIVHVSKPTSASNRVQNLSVGDNVNLAWHDVDGVLIKP